MSHRILSLKGPNAFLTLVFLATAVSSFADENTPPFDFDRPVVRGIYCVQGHYHANHCSKWHSASSNGNNRGTCLKLGTEGCEFYENDVWTTHVRCLDFNHQENDCELWANQASGGGQGGAVCLEWASHGCVRYSDDFDLSHIHYSYGSSKQDEDGDGISDRHDRCRNSPANSNVWKKGKWRGCSGGQFVSPIVRRVN